MKILIAGASGFIGQELVKALTQHSLTVLGRNRATLQQRFSNPVTMCTWDTLHELDAQTYDVLINLCGYNIAASRWTKEVKKQLIESRVNTNTTLIDWAIKQHAKPRFYCANAVGIYGLQENGALEAFDENSIIDFNHPRDFLSEIGIRWQQALQPAIDHGMQTTITRFGVVLKKGQGMLKN
ncbi:NAD-dependent epimerase/dehydratase family protein [Legionella tunisiensis]|uniref:NAD-dependent epimerase/dehydratase family protein n=1 Tax=Legionella tunisiensis TaxID=1034944 RepID=UPI00031AD996|nr:NAD-dependent epimerase/dehydratase family protein [Legionella tunisiensis]